MTGDAADNEITEKGTHKQSPAGGIFSPKGDGSNDNCPGHTSTRAADHLTRRRFDEPMGHT